MPAFLCNFVVFYLFFSFQLTYSIQTTGRSEKKHQRDTVFAWKGCLQSSYEEPKPHDEALIKGNIVSRYVQCSKNADHGINQFAVSVVRNTLIHNQCREMRQSTTSFVRYIIQQSVSWDTLIYNQYITCRHLHFFL